MNSNIVLIFLTLCCCLSSVFTLQYLTDYNALVRGNMQSKSSDCEGRLVVGGKLDVSNYAVGSRLVQNCSRIDLQVGGDFIGKDGQTSRGRTTVGGTNYAEDSWGTPCGPIENDPISFDIDAAFNDFISQSTSMGQQSSTGTETVSYSDLYLSGNDSNVNYFNVDSSILPSIRGIHIDIPSESWATVNFHGTSAEFEDMNFFLSSTTNKQKVLYNFPEAEVIYSTRNSFQGSLLAPTASLYDSNGNIEGSVAVSSYCGSGEFHNYPYIPPSSSCRCIPCTKSITLPSFEYYSLFIHKNINSEATDFEGRVAAGGDVNFDFIGVGSKLNESLNLDALQVNGDLYYHDGDVKGNVIVEGSSDIQDVSVSGETSQGSTGINFSHQFLELEAHSEFLSLWNANGNVDVIYSTIDLYGQDFYLNTFNIDYNTLENARTIVLSVPTNSHVIINVDGSGSPSSTVKFQNSGIFLNGASPSRILWNFFNLHHLEMSSIQIEGSLLAPNVDVSFSSGNLNGAIFAKSYTGGGEIHLSGWVPLPVPCIPCPC